MSRDSNSSVSSELQLISVYRQRTWSTMVRIEEVHDESEKLRQQGFADEKDEDDEWEATDADTDDVCVFSLNSYFFRLTQTGR